MIRRALLVSTLVSLIVSVASAQAPQTTKDQAHSPNSLSDQNAKQEPTAKTTPDSKAPAGVLVNGMLAVPGGPGMTQTTPAKFSDANDADDHIPIMARGPRIDDAQRTRILAALRDVRSAASVTAGPAMSLPSDVEMHEWPLTLLDQVPTIKDTKYVALSDKVLIVRPSNRIVIGEIAK
jgi:hypothetical protein